MLLYWHHTPHVQAVLRQSTGLVKAEVVDCSTEVDATRTDTEDVLSPQPLLCKHDADGHRCRQRRWHDDRDQIQRTTDYQASLTASINLRTIINQIITITATTSQLPNKYHGHFDSPL